MCRRFDAPRVVKAFLTHDLPTLRKHCGPELMERLTGIFNHFEAQVGDVLSVL
jgi:import inner membrane translocase subunit TIM44